MEARRRVCALVAYDGTDYHGFQFQVSVPTIQGILEDALAHCSRHRGRVIGSGRTDTGVHAAGQVILTEVAWRHSLGDLLRAWNHYLPDAVLIRRIAEAPEEFHPRYSASRRTYRYMVWHGQEGCSAPPRFPLLDRCALVVPERLDVEAMNEAGQALVGEHDFKTFGRPTQGDVTVRRVESLHWEWVRTNVPNIAAVPLEPLIFTVSANAFLRRMVRNFVGTLLEVGRGDRAVEDVEAALKACDRRRSGAPALARGLVLERVDYEEYPEIFGVQQVEEAALARDVCLDQ